MAQYIKKIVLSFAAMMSAAVIFTASASATDYQNLCSSLTSGVGQAGLTCTVMDPEFGSAPSGNDKEASVEAALAYVYGEIIDIAEMAKVDNSTGSAGDFTVTTEQSGSDITYVSWEYSGLAGSGPEFATVKSANGYALFFVGGLTSGNLFSDGLIVNSNNGNAKNISHITFWNGDAPQVSTPEIASLMLIGLASVALGTRRRKNT